MNKSASPAQKLKQKWNDEINDEDQGGPKPEVWSLPVRPNFGALYLPNRKGV